MTTRAHGNSATFSLPGQALRLFPEFVRNFWDTTLDARRPAQSRDGVEPALRQIVRVACGAGLHGLRHAEREAAADVLGVRRRRAVAGGQVLDLIGAFRGF